MKLQGFEMSQILECGLACLGTLTDIDVHFFTDTPGGGRLNVLSGGFKNLPLPTYEPATWFVYS